MMDLAHPRKLHRIRQFRHDNAERDMLRSKRAYGRAEERALRARRERDEFDARRRQAVKRIYDEILGREIAPQTLDEARERESHLKERLAILIKEAEEKARAAKEARAAYEEALRQLHIHIRALHKAAKILEDAKKEARKNLLIGEDALIDEFAERMAWGRG